MSQPAVGAAHVGSDDRLDVVDPATGGVVDRTTVPAAPPLRRTYTGEVLGGLDHHTSDTGSTI